MIVQKKQAQSIEALTGACAGTSWASVMELAHDGSCAIRRVSHVRQVDRKGDYTYDNDDCSRERPRMRGRQSDHHHQESSDCSRALSRPAFSKVAYSNSP